MFDQLALAVVFMDRTTQSLKFWHDECTEGVLDVYCMCSSCHTLLCETRHWVLFSHAVYASWGTRTTPSFGLYHTKKRRLATTPCIMVHNPMFILSYGLINACPAERLCVLDLAVISPFVIF